MSSFDYPAIQTKFGGFWTMPLLESTSAGLWTFDSRVDGEFAGEIRFEIVSAKRPAEASMEKVLPTPAEIYSRALAAVALIEKLDERGQPIGSGSGFFASNGMLITAFRVIDGAHTLRIQLPDGSRVQSESVTAWNRRQDWVIVKIDAAQTKGLPVATMQSWSVGDHCYWLDAKTDGGRVIADGQIVGKQTKEGWGDRISISNTFSTASTGGPLLNERGEVLGLLGGAYPESLVPHVLGGGETYGHTISSSVVPLNLVTALSNTSPATLHSLWSAGAFVPPGDRFPKRLFWDDHGG